MQHASFPACQPELEPFDYAAGLATSGPVPEGTAPIQPGKAVKADFSVGVTLDPPANGPVEWLAAAPPDHRTSYGGSALPFATPRQAFEGTPNTGKVDSIGGRSIKVVLQFPNSYYTGLGTQLVPPTVYLRYMSATGSPVRTAIKLSHGVPYRSLSHPPSRTGAEFYDNIAALPVRSQEQILYDSGYPSTNKEAPNFWGLKPAV